MLTFKNYLTEKDENVLRRWSITPLDENTWFSGNCFAVKYGSDIYEELLGEH